MLLILALFFIYLLLIFFIYINNSINDSDISVKCKRLQPFAIAAFQ